LGSEQVSKVRSNLLQFLKHLILVAAAPEDPAMRHWRGELRGFQDGAAYPYRASMRQLLEPELDRVWRKARDSASDKLGRALPYLPDACPFPLEALLDEDAPLGPLLARLRPPDTAQG
jgi:hypothetical protein